MKQETAVEFLLSRIFKTDYTKVSELIEEAKEMEKNQITDALKHGYHSAKIPSGSPLNVLEKEYYNQIYKTE